MASGCLTGGGGLLQAGDMPAGGFRSSQKIARPAANFEQLTCFRAVIAPDLRKIKLGGLRFAFPARNSRQFFVIWLGIEENQSAIFATHDPVFGRREKI